jgi:hypothetical protein
MGESPPDVNTPTPNDAASTPEPRVVPWWSYMADRPPLPPVQALHGGGPHHDRSELADMGLTAAQVNGLLRDRDTLAAAELDYLLFALDGGAA